MQKLFLIIHAIFLFSSTQILAAPPVQSNLNFSQIEQILKDSNDAKTIGRLFNELEQIRGKEEFEAYRYLTAAKYYLLTLSQEKNIKNTTKEGEKKIIETLALLTDQDIVFILQDNPDSIYLQAKRFSWLGFSTTECPKEQYEDLKQHLGLENLSKNFLLIWGLVDAYESLFAPKYSQRLSVVLENKEGSVASFVRNLIAISERLQSSEIQIVARRSAAT
jgi:hypothetical protein